MDDTLLQEMRTDIKALMSKVDKMETKLDGALGSQEDHEKRIRSLEVFKYKFIGAVAFCLAAADWLMFYVLHHH